MEGQLLCWVYPRNWFWQYNEAIGLGIQLCARHCATILCLHVGDRSVSIVARDPTPGARANLALQRIPWPQCLWMLQGILERHQCILYMSLQLLKILLPPKYMMDCFHAMNKEFFNCYRYLCTLRYEVFGICGSGKSSPQ